MEWTAENSTWRQVLRAADFVYVTVAGTERHVTIRKNEARGLMASLDREYESGWWTLYNAGSPFTKALYIDVYGVDRIEDGGDDE